MKLMIFKRCLTKIKWELNERVSMGEVKVKSGFGNQIPPDMEHVMIWFLQKGSNEISALSFYKYYEDQRWLNSKGRVIKDWKMTAWEWFWF